MCRVHSTFTGLEKSHTNRNLNLPNFTWNKQQVLFIFKTISNIWHLNFFISTIRFKGIPLLPYANMYEPEKD